MDGDRRPRGPNSKLPIMDMEPYLGYGLTQSGQNWRVTLVFARATDEKAARKAVVQQLAREGEIALGTVKVIRGDSIPADWLVDALGTGIELLS